MLFFLFVIVFFFVCCRGDGFFCMLEESKCHLNGMGTLADRYMCNPVKIILSSFLKGLYSKRKGSPFGGSFSLYCRFVF